MLELNPLRDCPDFKALFYLIIFTVPGKAFTFPPSFPPFLNLLSARITFCVLVKIETVNKICKLLETSPTVCELRQDIPDVMGHHRMCSGLQGQLEL